MSSAARKAILAVARDAATAAGALLRERFGGPVTGVDTKTTVTDLVSDADRDAEILIVRTLRARRPNDAIVGEEGARQPGDSGLRWLIDPLDGTVNFLYGVPHWCVSIACADSHGSLVGVIHDPCRSETFVATRSDGARLGDQTLHVTEGTDLARSLIATGFAYDSQFRSLQAEVVERVLPYVRDIRRFGSAALDLAWLAAGRCDGYFETGVNVWDTAAGALLVREAAGILTEVSGLGRDRRQGVVASNRHIHEQLLTLLRAEPLAEP